MEQDIICFMITLQLHQLQINSYRLTVSRFHSATTFDVMAFHNGRLFTTYDRDNDPYPANCALLKGPSVPVGGRWHRNCWHINLNKFLYTYTIYSTCEIWLYCLLYTIF